MPESLKTEKEMQAMRALLNRTHHMPQEVFNEEATKINATNSSLATSPPHVLALVSHLPQRRLDCLSLTPKR